MTSDYTALLAGIVANPDELLRWLILADWLDDHGQYERAELVRVHSELLRTCTDPDAHSERSELHARMMELMRGGAKPCLPERTLIVIGGEFKMSFIPPGRFLMGSPATENGRCPDEPQNLFALKKGFWLGQTPVTQAQWRAVMGTSPSAFGGGVLPVERVSWDAAQAFCVAVSERTGVNVRLPTEAEWEYAYRAGTTTPYYWGTTANVTQLNCCGGYCYSTGSEVRYPNMTTMVGCYADVVPHPWGLADMSGNVWEWCADWYAECPYANAAAANGTRVQRVIRGGGWFSVYSSCRAARRSRRMPSNTESNVGLRIVADL